MKTNYEKSCVQKKLIETLFIPSGDNRWESEKDSDLTDVVAVGLFFDMVLGTFSDKGRSDDCTTFKVFSEVETARRSIKYEVFKVAVGDSIPLRSKCIKYFDEHCYYLRSIGKQNEKEEV